MDSHGHDCHQIFWMSRLAGNCLNKDPQKRLDMNTVSLHFFYFFIFHFHLDKVELQDLILGVYMTIEA